MLQLAKEKRPTSGGIRWMPAVDRGKSLVKKRRKLQYINAKAIQRNNCSLDVLDNIPAQTEFTEVFDIVKHSLLVGAHFVRQDEFFQSQRMNSDALDGFRETFSKFI